MPHKHTRRKGDDDKYFDLPPTKLARPLSAFNKELQDKSKHSKQSKRQPKPTAPVRERAFATKIRGDDTPRAFARVMRLQHTGQKRRSGLDDGPTRTSKKRKGEEVLEPLPEISKTEHAALPKIMPGERMADFAARVDQALPFSGLARKGNVKIEGMKDRQTKTEKRLHKMYAAWRVEDAKIKEKLEEDQELEEEAEEERETALGGQSLKFPEGRKAKRRRMIGEAKMDNEDPWAELKAKRDAPKGLHDVAQAPPTLRAVKEKFKTRNGAQVDVANVPVASGSLKRREELSAARKEVIERYRTMMKKGD